MNLNKCLQQAESLAIKARPWILKQDNKVYTGVFNHAEWVYDVYEDGIFLMKINMKQPSKAKAYLSKWLVS